MTALSKVKNVTTEAMWNKLKGRKNLVFVHFATMRTPAEVTKFINNLSRQPEYRRVTFIKFDMDKLGSLAAKMGVISSPTFHCYRSGELLEGFSGLIPQKMIAVLDKHNKQSSKKGLPFGGSLVALVAATAMLVFGLRARSKTAFAAAKEEAAAAASAAVAEDEEDDDEEDEEEEEGEEEEEEEE